MINYLPSLLFDFNEIIELDTEIMEIFHKSSEILEKFPELRQSIDNNLTVHGLKKKQLRKKIQRY